MLPPSLGVVAGASGLTDTATGEAVNLSVNASGVVEGRTATTNLLVFTVAATEDTPVTFAAADLLGNDSDVDGDSLSIASVTSGTGGTAVLNDPDPDGHAGERRPAGQRRQPGGDRGHPGDLRRGRPAGQRQRRRSTAVPPVPLVTLAMLRLSPSTSLSLPSRSAAAKVTGVSSVAARRVVHRRDRQGQGRGVGQAAVGDGVVHRVDAVEVRRRRVGVAAVGRRWPTTTAWRRPRTPR
ncbi:cadherin-like domain-containing protein [Pseudomonas stutzeri]|nr:cadherin-like domain-containing protein [Stutzerimonas stutzeri]